MKICSRCKEKKPFESFYLKKNTSGKHSSHCKECCKKTAADSIQKLNSTIHGRAKSAIRNANRRVAKNGHALLLSVDDIVELWDKQSGICAYSGMEMTFASNELNTMSLERIDSSIGYTKENTILICHAINRMKSNFGIDDFHKLCYVVSSFLGKPKTLD
jgi:hypothetical protein